ncbi:MAG: cell division protein FtsA [Rikenellaceae bacterium]|nr:cell division protein FtsA [Rikenellaceae bacterium]
MEKRNYIVAIDPGSANITIAVGAVGNEGRLHIEEIVSGAMQGITRGEIANRQQVSASISEAIRAVEQKLGLRISDVYMGSSGKHIRCASHDYYVYVADRSEGEIQTTDVSALHDMMNNIQAQEGIKILDRIPLEYVIDESNSVKDPVGMFGKKLSTTFNFVLASTTLLERMDKTLLALGIATRRTIAAAIASAEAVLLPEEREMGVAVVDLGSGTTDVSVWYDNEVRFVRSIPLGAGDIDSDIHQQGILDKRIGELKHTFGVAMTELVVSDKLISIAGRSPREKQEISQKNLAIIIENRLREIIGYVVAEIGDSGYAGRLKKGIVLTGGGSQLKGIDELFSHVTGMEVRLGVPDVNVAEDSVELAQNPAYSTVIGLLLKALEQGARAGAVQRNLTYERAPVSSHSAGVTQPKPEPARGLDKPTQERTLHSGSGFVDDEEDEDSDKRPPKKGSWIKLFGKKVMDGFMPDDSLEDEDI